MEGSALRRLVQHFFQIVPMPLLLLCQIKTHIHSIANQHNHGGEVEPQHQSDDRADGSVELVVTRKVFQIENKPIKRNRNQKPGEFGTCREKMPLVMDRRGIAKNKGRGQVKYGQKNKKLKGIEQEDDKCI